MIHSWQTSSQNIFPIRSINETGSVSKNYFPYARSIDLEKKRLSCNLAARVLTNLHFKENIFVRGSSLVELDRIWLWNDNPGYQIEF